jgi:hypothetical protein
MTSSVIVDTDMVTANGRFGLLPGAAARLDRLHRALRARSPLNGVVDGIRRKRAP